MGCYWPNQTIGQVIPAIGIEILFALALLVSPPNRILRVKTRLHRPHLIFTETDVVREAVTESRRGAARLHGWGNSLNYEALNGYVLMVIGLFGALLYIGLLYAGLAEFIGRISKKITVRSGVEIPGAVDFEISEGLFDGHQLKEVMIE